MPMWSPNADALVEVMQTGVDAELVPSKWMNADAETAADAE